MTLEKDSKVPLLNSKSLEDIFLFFFLKWDMKNEDRSTDRNPNRAIYLLSSWEVSGSPRSLPMI